MQRASYAQFTFKLIKNQIISWKREQQTSITFIHILYMIQFFHLICLSYFPRFIPSTESDTQPRYKHTYIAFNNIKKIKKYFSCLTRTTEIFDSHFFNITKNEKNEEKNDRRNNKNIFLFLAEP